MMKKPRTIHFVGIKGVGMAPLAVIAKEAGINISGSDLEDEFITDEVLKKAGISTHVGFNRERIKNIDLLITTGAHGGYDNEEVIAAKEKGIPVLTQGEAIGEFMNGAILGRSFTGISVAGSHGKTTTTAMLATILSESNYDPSYLIGTGIVPSLGLPGHFGKGKYFIAEADEYATEPVYNKKPKLLWQHPKIAIFTNIELDHPDLYASVEDVRDAFLQFAKIIPSDGVLIAGGDDEQVQKLITSYAQNIITFGLSKSNNYIITKIYNSNNQTFFWLEAQGTSLGEFSINVVGEHNVLNATAAVIAALEAGASIEKVKKALPRFTGSKRRFEYVGKMNSGAFLYDDYAHHPTEIKKTLESFHQKFPDMKILCIFQPHTYSRTKKMFEQFVGSFFYAHAVVICDIYPSLREKEDTSVSSKGLVEAIGKLQSRVLFLPKVADVIEYINKIKPDSNTVIVTMGAGDIYKLHEKLIGNVT